jgi:phenylpropionate dioxygenase-like ring-hydroxylating dioxygenase large terminal subunit
MDRRFIDQVNEGIARERSRRAPPEDFPLLGPIPPGRYSDRRFLELETEHLWKKSWLYACHSDELPGPGSFLLWSKTGTQILIVKAKDDRVRAFYNTCSHRGSPLVDAERGSRESGFVCPYHGWAYDLEGRLRGVRERRDFTDIDRACLGLVPVRCECLGNWVFVNEDHGAPPLLESLGPFVSHMQQFDPGRIRHIESYGYDVECNVKVMLEAFLEVYHLNVVHPDTVERFLDHRGTLIILWPQGHSLMVTPNRDPEWVDPGTVGLAEFPGVGELPVRNNISYNVFPNLVTPVSTSGIPFVNLWPTGPASMRIDCHWFAADTGEGERHPQWDVRIENFNRILGEDMALVPKVQKSMGTKGFRGARLSYQERRIYHWHEELDRRIGVERIPAELRVKPCLADMIER